MNERILSDDEIEALRKHWASAPTIDEAAKRLGICRETARLWARKIGSVRPSNHWTPERTERLIALTMAGYSGSAIANDLGVSRNSVIGKVHRLGMQIGNSKNAKGHISTGKPQKPVLTSSNKYRKPKVKSKPVFEKAPIPQQRAEDIARKSFSELSENDCRFPVNHPKDSDFGFCGLPQIPGSSYCAAHHARCWQSVPVKTRPTLRETTGVKVDA